MVKRFVLIFAFTLGSSFVSQAQQPSTPTPAPATARAEVLVLGVYHMANPGRDVFNMQADDVLAPKRQAEIAQLMEVLKKFQPTKIAIEADMYGKQRQESIIERALNRNCGFTEEFFNPQLLRFGFG